MGDRAQSGLDHRLRRDVQASLSPGDAPRAHNSVETADRLLWMGIAGGRPHVPRRHDDGGVHIIGWSQTGHVVMAKGGEMGLNGARHDGTMVASQCHRSEVNEGWGVGVEAWIGRYGRWY